MLRSLEVLSGKQLSRRIVTVENRIEKAKGKILDLRDAIRVYREDLRDLRAERKARGGKRVSRKATPSEAPSNSSNCPV